jgi:superfamily II DNA or RNA helicase
MNRTSHGNAAVRSHAADQIDAAAYPSTDNLGDVLEVPAVKPRLSLASNEELELQQLLQARFWFSRSNLTQNRTVPEPNDVEGELPARWDLTGGTPLYEWQQRCCKAWFKNGGKGVIKVVTGAGKTLLALSIAETLQREQAPNLCVAVIVPTIVLLEQWFDELTSRSNLPRDGVGRLGGGHADIFSDRTRILICVLNSAALRLPSEVERAGISKELLLIVDECHRAGASEMRRVFQARRTFSLGLSATPERDDDPGEDGEGAGEEQKSILSFEETVLGRELGPVIFEMNYAEAIHLGVLPPFQIVHYGLSLQPRERESYDKISREISDLKSELEAHGRHGVDLLRWCRSKAAAGNPKAARLVGLISKRKRLLYRMSERSAAVVSILAKAFAQNADCKAILFHESIDEVMALFDALRKLGYPVVAEHSEFPDAMRAESLRLFREGAARIIVSARSLIEGFNVPSADIGIVVAASASVRQRVQTLGRLLRKNANGAGGKNDKQAVLYVLYARDTVDEVIYEKADWAQFVGADRNDYFVWTDVGSIEPVSQSNPPRVPMLDESSVDVSSLKPGDVYPANPDQGSLYSVDTQGTVRDEARNIIKPNPQVRAIQSGYRKPLGRFRVTPINRYVIKLEKDQSGWHGVYLGRLTEPLERATQKEESATGDAEQFLPGGAYPLWKARGKIFSVLQRDKRLIANKSAAGIRFVVPAEKLAESTKREALVQIQRRIADVYAKGHRINKIMVTDEGHVVYVFDGVAYFLGNAPEGPDGFLIES